LLVQDGFTFKNFRRSVLAELMFQCPLYLAQTPVETTDRRGLICNGFFYAWRRFTASHLALGRGHRFLLGF